MPRVYPYQPILLRILHGAAAVLTVLALISGFWVYNTYDKRWGALPLPTLGDIQGIHGTIALTFLLFLPIFALYSFHLGYRRLIQEQSLSQLKKYGKPVFWISIHHLINTLMLLSVTLAVVTGRMMKEEWLPAREINHPWYLVHLIAWVCVFISIALHLLMGAKVGGVPLLLSMFNWKVKGEDSFPSWLKGFKIKHSSLVLRATEFVVIGGIVLAFVLPVLSV
ncbi:cytochrome b/b6 domain-containing protein [Synechococcus sp. Nb3U1]|uniref:cytochrome b/b6 domain-containing protein n=1 Tax=Synechococcus sp. Nb3U1 TaxID=1914529 RepID=UPI001F3D1AB2|nr:cytochrome b/b6 domain-containing protein [Synechococcus sp. Nb3U1]MCF2970128.1 cytochrome b/b6 domain-containing protein [Synechococcus sp. Nb3U1]